jgi:solute carrier family 25 phosphate transporter 3
MSEETKRNLSITKKYSIALGSGVIAGFAAAILSHVKLHHPLPTITLI